MDAARAENRASLLDGLSWYGFKRGHLVIGRGHRRLWRSPGVYPSSQFDDVGPIVFGRRRLAFEYSKRVGKPRTLYVTGYRARQRRLSRGEMPLRFLGSGELLTLRERDHALLLRALHGHLERVVARRVAEAQVDRRNGKLVARVRLRVSVFNGGRLRHLIDLRKHGFKGLPTIEPLGRAVAIRDRRRLVVVDYLGRIVASSLLPRRREPVDGVSSSVAANSTGTAYAFTAIRRVTAGGSDPRESIFVLRAGEKRAKAILDEQLSLAGCGRTADLSWHGRWLLYSTTEQRAAVVDSSLAARPIELSGLIARLPGIRGHGESSFDISWAQP